MSEGAGPTSGANSAQRVAGSRVLPPLMLAAFADTLGSFLVLALLPYYAQEFGASGFEVGSLVAAFAVAQTLSAPLWGRLSDRWGRRGIILLGLLIQIVAFVAFAFAGSIAALVLSRLVQGLGAGTVSVTFALISDEARGSNTNDTAIRIGWLTAATSGAALVGPMLGSLLTPYSTQAPGLAAAAICALALVWCAAALPRVTERTEREASARDSTFSVDATSESTVGTEERPSLPRALVTVFTQPLSQAHLLIWTYAVGMFSTNAALAIIGLFLERRHAVDASRIWQFFAVLAGASLLIRVFALPPLLRRYGETRVLVIGAWGLALSLLSLPLAHTFWLVLLSTLLLAAGQSLLYPATTAQISAAAGRGGTGTLLGVQQACGGLGRIFGPIASGAILQAAGGEIAFLVVGAALSIWSVLLTWRLRERPSQHR